MSKEVKQFTTAKMDPAEIFGNACLKARYAVDELNWSNTVNVMEQLLLKN